MIALGWCRISLIVLIILQVAWFGWLTPPQALPMAFVLTVTIVPLLAVLPGVLLLRIRPLVIAGCLLLFYFSFAVMEAWARPEVRIQAFAQIILVAVYFTALPAVRKQQKQDD